jgi:hypothetical protein
MGQWLRLLLNQGEFEGKQVIAAQALLETYRPHMLIHSPANPKTEPTGFYGLGWNVTYGADGRKTLSHSGGFNLGAATVVSLLPGERLGIVVLTNGKPIGLPESISASFFDLVLKGEVEKDWLTAMQAIFARVMMPSYGTEIDYVKPLVEKSPSLPHESYLGAYDNAYYGVLEVVEKDQNIALKIGPGQREFALKHWNRDVYTYQPTGENAAGLSGVTFLIGPDRRANRVIVENLDTNGHGTFMRRSVEKTR